MKNLEWEWRTSILYLISISSWVFLSYLYQFEFGWLVIPFLIYLTSLQTSIRHEIAHGHPTNSVKINNILGIPALNLLDPFLSFKKNHLLHHGVTVGSPKDPESDYIEQALFEQFHPLKRALISFNHTLIGRVVVGPLFWLFGKRKVKTTYTDIAAHIAWCVVQLAFLEMIGFSALEYIMFVAYPSAGLSLIRSFIEHKIGEKDTNVVESSWFFSFLFLNNNIHIIHHNDPKLPWYDINRVYKRDKTKLRAEIGVTYAGYRDVFAKYAFKAKDFYREAS